MNQSIRKKFKNHRELYSKLDLIDDILKKLGRTRLSYLIHELTDSDHCGLLMTVVGHLVGTNILRYDDVRRERLKYKTPYISFVCGHTTTINHLTYLLESGYVPLHHNWQLTTRLLDPELILQNITTSNYECEYFFLLEPSPILRLMIDRSPLPNQRDSMIASIHDDMESISVGIVGFYETFYGSQYWSQILFE